MTQEQVEFLSIAKSQSGGTSLVTYSIPSNYNMWLVSEKLNNELGTAKNIKDKTVRKDVISALKTSLYLLKTYKKSKAPETGLILCAGITTDSNIYFWHWIK